MCVKGCYSTHQFEFPFRSLRIFFDVFRSSASYCCSYFLTVCRCWRAGPPYRRRTCVPKKFVPDQISSLCSSVAILSLSLILQQFQFSQLLFPEDVILVKRITFLFIVNDLASGRGHLNSINFELPCPLTCLLL